MVNNTFGDPRWALEWGYMQNVSIFGTYYDVILANDTSNYQRCVLESSPDGQCVKKAWLVPTTIGNFSSSQTKNMTVGQNFTTELYLASVGPRDGEGITVGNFSSIYSLGLPNQTLPAIGGFPLADGTTSYFAMLNETILGYNLDKNLSTNTTFYMLTFDSDFNGQQALTSTLIDDDLELLPWSLNSNGTETAYDFTRNEFYVYSNRTQEQWSSLPTGTWTGNARFGEDYPNVNYWEDQPNWDIPFYNNTHMILRKSEWRINASQPVDVLLKVFEFNQQAIQGANITLTQMAKASQMGFQFLSLSNYTINKTYNVTDSYGYGLIKIMPVSGTWTSGQYQVVFNVQASAGTETLERWFCVGSCGW
jgi:hypothetical protein